jgi:hypothetical protein
VLLLLLSSLFTPSVLPFNTGTRPRSGLVAAFWAAPAVWVMVLESTVDTGAPRERPRDRVGREWDSSTLPPELAGCVWLAGRVAAFSMFSPCFGSAIKVSYFPFLVWYPGVGDMFWEYEGEHKSCVFATVFVGLDTKRGLLWFYEASSWFDISARIWLAPLLVRLISKSIMNLHNMEQRGNTSSSSSIQWCQKKQQERCVNVQQSFLPHNNFPQLTSVEATSYYKSAPRCRYTM